MLISNLDIIYIIFCACRSEKKILYIFFSLQELYVPVYVIQNGFLDKFSRAYFKGIELLWYRTEYFVKNVQNLNEK